jgi:perosamine synthetase
VKYNTAFPYFAKEDINGILDEFRDILSGKGVLTKGENVKIFEKEFADYVKSSFAVTTNSGTTALEIVLRAIGVKEQDEVIVPAQTFVATASSVVINGAKPVFCEVDENFLLDFEDLKDKITSRTKAVIIVHFAGLIHPEIFAIKKYLQERNIYLIEDAAHASGAKIDGIYAGNIGDFGCFSFYSTKIMTSGEGGMITTNSPKFYALCSSLRSIGIDIGSGLEIFSNIGSNGRLTELQAILGRYQLRRLEDFVEHRNKIAEIYMEILKPVERAGIIAFQEFPPNIRHAYWRFLIHLKDGRISRDNVRDKMAKCSVRIDWPYSPLLHLQPVFKKLYGTKEGLLPKSETSAKGHFCIPIHRLIKEKDAELIGKKLLEVLNE